MDKKFKEVRNVLNMKNIIGAGIVMGTLFVSTSAFAAEQDQETTKVSIQDRVNNGSFNFQNQFDNDFASAFKLFNLKKLLKNNVYHFGQNKNQMQLVIQ